MKNLGGEGVERIIFKAYLHSELKVPAILRLSWVFFSLPVHLKNSEVFLQAAGIKTHLVQMLKGSVSVN